jgi:FHA domain
VEHIGIKDARIRWFLFCVGILLIALGGIAVVTHALGGDVYSSILTVFGTAMSFAQFSVGFTSLKPADKGVAPTVSAAPSTPKALYQLVKAKLINASDHIDLGATPFSIGRSLDNQKVLDDSQVSAYHAVIRPEGEGYALLDKGSTNGTWVNGERLAAEMTRILRPGDVIRMGNTTFTYEATVATVDAPTVVAPASLMPPPLPSYAQQAYTPFSFLPIPVPDGQKRYRGSGSVFLFAGLLSLIYAPLTLFEPSISVILLKWGILALIYVLALCGIRGLYQKQADRAGRLGTVGTIMLTASWLLYVFCSLIFLLILPLSLYSQLIWPKTIKEAISTLFYVDMVFAILGDFALGISMIRAAVYPLWTSIVLIIVGFLNIIIILAPERTGIAFITQLFVAALFCGWGITLIRQLPDYPPQRPYGKEES